MFRTPPAGPALALAGLLLAAWPPAAESQSPPGRFFLSWNAPDGEPRGRESLSAACGDSSRRDTLYVTFDPGRDTTRVIAVDAEIRLWPAPGDTLDRHWWFESRSNPANLLADFNLDGVPGAERIWEATGAGGVRTVSLPDTAKIRLVWAVRMQDGAVLRGGRRYGFARLIVPRPRSAGVCARPLCFELTYARLATDLRDADIIRQGKRWVSWNPGGTAPCAERVRIARVAPWRGPGTPRR